MEVDVKYIGDFLYQLGKKYLNKQEYFSFEDQELGDNEVKLIFETMIIGNCK